MKAMELDSNNICLEDDVRIFNKNLVKFRMCNPYRGIHWFE